jgi:NAD(P)-dependent dehydrogenase (short-subunit alcohol dehydrogenase family)
MRGQVAIVVGGHSGFGAAITRRFAGEGAHVVVAARRAQLAREVAESVGGTGESVDVTDDEQVQALVQRTVAAHGRLDVAVNCAGFQQSTPIADLTPERLRAMLDVQLAGALYCMRHMGNAMADSGGGAFVNISSLTAHNPSRGLAAYASAKAGLEYATQIAAVEYGAKKVRFNCVAAGLIETPMTEAIFANPLVVPMMLEVTPSGRMGTPDDIANAVWFLASDQGSFVNGQTLCVDGGASLLMLPTSQMYLDAAARLASSTPDGPAG